MVKPVNDRKENFLTLKPLLQSKFKRPKHFKVFKESSLPWNTSITHMFKEYELNQHKGADQDVDTDDDNIEFGREQLLGDLRKQIHNYQTDEQYAVRNIMNTTMFKHVEGIQFLTLDWSKKGFRGWLAAFHYLSKRVNVDKTVNSLIRRDCFS